MRRWTRNNARDVPQVPTFAHSADAGGHLYVSGMLGLEDDFSRVVGGGVGAETLQAFRHVERILKYSGASLSDIAKVTVYMIDLGQLDALNEAYLTLFDEGKTPTRTTIGCAALLFGASVEFDCIAYR
jgi:2-iminobutanoate/2-iminopropanoate deaminase